MCLFKIEIVSSFYFLFLALTKALHGIWQVFGQDRPSILVKMNLTVSWTAELFPSAFLFPVLIDVLRSTEIIFNDILNKTKDLDLFLECNLFLPVLPKKTNNESFSNIFIQNIKDK